MDITVGSATSLSNISYTKAFAPQPETGQAFDEFFDAAVEMVAKTNEYQQKADRAQLDLASGKTDDMLAVLLAQEKAYSSLNFTVQVTSKAIESYREIMRMQI
jgi:flagellar hook-basal body complex protein FliE